MDRSPRHGYWYKDIMLEIMMKFEDEQMREQVTLNLVTECIYLAQRQNNGFVQSRLKLI